MRISTSRIGLLSVHASAPVLDGELSEDDLRFTVRIDQVRTGNPLLDPELHALVHALTAGRLLFAGRRAGEVFTGSAQAGDISVPLDLAVTGGGATRRVSGTSTFRDVHIPLPGIGRLPYLEVDIEGHLHLAD